MSNHAAQSLVLDLKQQRQLEYLRASGKTPQKIALRAKLILLASQGKANSVIAKTLGISRPTVLLWRKRFGLLGVPGMMKDAPRTGRKKALSSDKVAAVVEATLHSRPEGQTHWSVRSMARAQGISRMAVQRIWKLHQLQPHRVESFKLSNDKQFVAKLRDVVGLYMSPPPSLRPVILSNHRHRPCRREKNVPSVARRGTRATNVSLLPRNRSIG